MARKRSIEIYLKEGIEEDDQIFAVWEALRERGRPQDVFRRMLRSGLRAMVEAGELPRVALKQVDADLLMPMPPAHALLNAAGPRSQAPARRKAAPRGPAPVTGVRKEFETSTRITSDTEPGYPLPEPPIEDSPIVPVDAEAVREPVAVTAAEPSGAAGKAEGRQRPRIGRLM